MLSIQQCKMHQDTNPHLCWWHTFVFLVLTLLVTRTMTHSSGLQAKRLQKFVGLIQPEQVHLAFGKTSRDIVIMWATRRDVQFSVEIAETADKLKRIEAQRSVLEQSSERAAKYLHRVYVSDLKPGVKYTYRIATESTGANSNIFSFKVPYDIPGKVHIFMILADMGLSSKSLKFLSYEAANGMYEALFHVGDIAYNLHRDEGTFGDQFLRHVEKAAAKMPYMTVPGDHERFLDFSHYRYRFSMPDSPWPMPVERLWYSIDIGPVHFVALNTEVFYTLHDQEEKQLEWLVDDLDNANQKRQEHPWIIVLGHRPMYCSETDFSEQPDCVNDTSCAIRSKLEDLFFEQGVDLYISGHNHNYERSWPLYRGNVFQHGYRNPKAPVHIINGAMGYQYLVENIIKPKVWSAFGTSDPKKELYGRLEVLNSSHLLWDVYDASNNAKVDSIAIIQQRHGSFGRAGDGAYQEMVKLQQLPPAPFHWQPPEKSQESEVMLHALYELPPSTRKLYLLTMCLTLLSTVLVLLCLPSCRRKLCRTFKM